MELVVQDYDEVIEYKDHLIMFLLIDWCVVKNADIIYSDQSVEKCKEFIDNKTKE